MQELVQSYIEKIFFFEEGRAGSGMSDDLFFTHVYFWLFFAGVLGIYSIINDTNKWIRTAFLGLFTIGAVGLATIISPALKLHVIAWGVFALFLITYSLQDKRRAVRNGFLFAVSLFFYYKISGFFFLILVFSTMVDYTIGICIHKSKPKTLRFLLVATSIVVNLTVLCYFKYAYFFTDSYNEFIVTLNETFGSAFRADYVVHNMLADWANEYSGGGFRVDKILLPVGVSFYTFQTISYSVDVYRRHIKPVYNLLDFGFYVSFFPQLVAGPIVRASQFIPQLYKDYKLNKYEFGMAVFLILNGLLKKAFLADFIANGFIDGVFGDPLRYTGFEGVMAIFGYSLQVYADFSGYTDIAIGIALLMGFRLNWNFNSPYKATNVGDFWRRWHISLSTWLRDYLYIPLGGNQRGTIASYICIAGILVFFVFLSGQYWISVLILMVALSLATLVAAIGFPAIRRWVNTNINLMITMLLGGLWHGPSWNFVIWGGLNGLGLVVYKLWKDVNPLKYKTGYAVRAWQILVTFTFISFTRIFFRSSDMQVAEDLMTQIGTSFNAALIPEIIGAYWFYYLVLVVGMIIHWLPVETKIWYRHLFIRSHVLIKIAVVSLVVYVSYQSLLGAQPFIYFQF